MSQQSSILVNPLNDSSIDDNQKEDFSNDQSEQEEEEQQEQEQEAQYPKNPLESDEEGNESSVLQHLINNDNQSSKSNELSNPMIGEDPISLENIHNQNFESIGQQYHICQTVLDCNKTNEFQQDLNPLYSCDELLDPRQSNKEKSKDIIQNLESQLESIQKEKQLLKKQLIEKEMSFIEQLKIKDQELNTVYEYNKNLIDENSKLKGKVSNQQNEIQSLQQQIKQIQSEQFIQQRHKTEIEIARYDPQDLHKATSLNDQAIAFLSANQLEVRKIPTLSIDIPYAFSSRPKQSNKDQFTIKNGTSNNDLITEKSNEQRVRKMPQNQRSLQDLIHKAQIGNAFSKTNTASLQKVQGSGQLFFENNSTKRNQQQILLASKQ